MRSIKEDCLNHVVPLGEGFLRAAVKDYVEFYNQERPHQGLNNRFLIVNDEQVDSEASVKVKERLGGLLSYYYR